MPVTGTPSQRKATIFREFKAGDLHSGPGGPLVKNRTQAIAIALSEAKPKRPKRTVLRRG